MIKIEPSNVWTKLTYDSTGASPLKNILNSHFKVDVPGAQFLYMVKSGQWDGKASLWEDEVDPVTKDHTGVNIRTGLVPRLIEVLNMGGVEWEAGSDHRTLPYNHTLQSTKVPIRPYQYDAVKAAFQNRCFGFNWWPQGVQSIATGGGKTELAVAMYEMNPMPTAFLVHRKDLLVQAKTRFEKYGYDVGIIGYGKVNPKSDITIATMQTLYSIIQKDDSTDPRTKKLEQWLQGINQVFFDEAHLMASDEKRGNQFVYVADRIPASFRWGLTATPFMRAQYDNLLLEAVTGKVLYKISTNELVNLGYLTPPKVIIKNVPGKMTVTRDWKQSRSNKAKAEYWRTVESKGIKFNSARTALIIDEIKQGPYPCLILVKTIEQADYINTLYKNDTGKDIPFVSGKSSVNDRLSAVEGLRNGTIPAIMATTIFDEGIDIPELMKVILASGGKSAVKLIQRVGRVVRKADGKEEAIIIDFDDAHHTMLANHFKARLNTYNEQGFNTVYEN